MTALKRNMAESLGPAAASDVEPDQLARPSGRNLARDSGKPGASMRLGKAAYYADFFIYPLILLCLGTTLFWAESGQQKAVWFTACAAGAIASSLMEYVTHRYVLHHAPLFREMHAQHHMEPVAFVGTPAWLSSGVLCIFVFLPLWWYAGWELSSGFTFGVGLGYLWYVMVHHAVHRWTATEGTYLHRAKRRHARHHGNAVPCNFGVTTDLWDRLLGSTP